MDRVVRAVSAGGGMVLVATGAWGVLVRGCLLYEGFHQDCLLADLLPRLSRRTLAFTQLTRSSGPAKLPSMPS